MEILENSLSHLPDFIALNEQWVKHYFQLEDVDRQLAADPGKIISDGGFIFTLIVDKKAVGVCALFKKVNQGTNAKDSDVAGDLFELARMAVDPDFQGKGYGQHLIDRALQKLVELKAAKVFLLSNQKLKAAISLYQKNGFVVVAEGEHPVYSRCDVVMERIIS